MNLYILLSTYSRIGIGFQNITLLLLEYDGGIIVEIEAPFYDDPPPPLLEKGM